MYYWDSPYSTGSMAGLDMNNKKSALPPGVYGTFFRPPTGPSRGGMVSEPAPRAIFGNYRALKLPHAPKLP